jgi:hypothetical protein
MVHIYRNMYIYLHIYKYAKINTNIYVCIPKIPIKAKIAVALLRSILKGLLDNTADSSAPIDSNNTP